MFVLPNRNMRGDVSAHSKAGPPHSNNHRAPALFSKHFHRASGNEPQGFQAAGQLKGESQTLNPAGGPWGAVQKSHKKRHDPFKVL